MKCILLNKNTEIAIIEFNEIHKYISEVYEVKNIEYAPLGVYNAYHDKSVNFTKELNNWFKGRGIPSWRKDLEGLLERLHISSTEELLDQAYGLSLSDQYWFKEIESPVKWEDINFFTHDFEYETYLNASLDSSSRNPVEVSLKSPNNTTDGMLQKSWSIEDGKRVLVKGTYTSNHEEPFNEWLASQISKRLNFDYCNYIVAWYGKDIISKCDNFLNENEEIISANDIYHLEKKPNDKNDYEHYISILEKHGVVNARKNTASMFIVDYLMLNTDRHLKNFGVIRNAETLEWEKTTPIFDTGQSMNCDRYTYDMDFHKGTGKFFTNTAKDYEAILKTIGYHSVSININDLDGIAEDYEGILRQYQDRLEISDQRIVKLTDGLRYRIHLLGKHIEND